MKIVMLSLMAAALLLAQDRDSKPGKDGIGIPKGAAQVGPNLYRDTDAQGKTWFYRRSPFGISKWEDKPEVPRVVAEPLTTTHDLGDKVEFQRQTPFGISKWVTQKKDLTTEEKALLAADEAKRAAASNTGETASTDQGREKRERE